MARPKRAFFVINSLEGGGAERVFATLVGELAGRLSASIELVLLDRFEEKYAIPEGVVRHQLDSGQRFGSSIVQLATLARRERPDLLFSFLNRANCAAIIAGRIIGAPVVISERVHTTSHFGRGILGTINRLVVRGLYPRADHVVAASHGVAEDLSTHYGVRRNRLSVIYNPVRRDEIRCRAGEPLPIDLPGPVWLAIGRLVPNKNFPMLIEAFAEAQVPGHLMILGEGPEHDPLMRLAALRQISDRVHLPGHVANPYACLSRAYAYLSASNAEGFPNALVEALVLGCPVAVTDCDSGPAEILRGALAPKVGGMLEVENGILVPTGDARAMAQAMRALTVEITRRRYAQAAVRRANDFDLAQTIDSYAGILERAVAGHLGSNDKD